MNSGISDLHRILKDKTRCQILSLLNDEGSLNYTCLMNQLGITNTGKLNYHLKMLDDLITKKPEGSYLLSEKGKLAVQLLNAMSKENRRQILSNRFPVKNLIQGIVSSGLLILLVLYFYFSQNISINWVIGSITIFVGTIIGVIIAAKLPSQIPEYSYEKRRTGTKIGFIILGAGIGMIAGLICGSLILLATINSLRLVGVSQVYLGFTLWATVSSIVGIISGGLITYIIFRRSKYSKIDYYQELV